MCKYIAFLIITFYTQIGFSQIIGIDHDSTISYCKIDELVKYAKWNYDKDGVSFKYELEFIDSLKRTKQDTIVLSYTIFYDAYDGLTDRLIKQNRTIFYDKRTNKFIRNIKVKRNIKIKEYKYNSYVDMDTGKEFWFIIKKVYIKAKF